MSPDNLAKEYVHSGVLCKVGMVIYTTTVLVISERPFRPGLPDILTPLLHTIWSREGEGGGLLLL